MKLSRMVLGTLFITFFATFAHSSFANTKNHDGEIIAFMEAIDNHEVDVSKVAKDKNVDKKTMKFAEMMISQHSKNLQQVKDVSEKINVSADETKAVKRFKDKGDKELDKLSKLNDNKFQNAYINSMIKGHTEANEMLARFLKEVKNADLQKYLSNTKTVVEHHLAEAKRLK